ncbi:MAG: insulinase family protein [Flavobacteriales bacterium]|nr:insulinase family protein [Flavobacteriales bacterium]
MVLDRINQPAFSIPENIDLKGPLERELDNGIPVYSFYSDKQDLVKLDFIFNLDYSVSKLPLVTSLGSMMLNEGTERMSAVEIANAIDYFGCFLRTGSTRDSAVITLYSLNKHLESALPIVEQILKESRCPENELTTVVNTEKQRLAIKMDEVDVISQREFNSDIYGNTPYGYQANEHDYNAIVRDDLIGYYSKIYKSSNCKVILTGNIPESTFRLVNKYFGGSDWSGNALTTNSFEIPVFSESRSRKILKNKAVQCSIRVGKQMINKTHEDFMKLQILNTVLGGFFGSRLMSNLREDKGLTYGVYSALSSFKNGGSFFVTLETGVENSAKALDEIYKELKRLREEKIGIGELELVKNYLSGEVLRSVDGIFSISDYYKGLMTYGLDGDYLAKVMGCIRNVTSTELNDLANKYLMEDSMHEVVVG